MTPADLDAAAAAVLSWLLTYAIHSTILLAIAAAAAWRFADQHAWLDLIWKAALIGPLVTASLQLDPICPAAGRTMGDARRDDGDRHTSSNERAGWRSPGETYDTGGACDAVSVRGSRSQRANRPPLRRKAESRSGRP